MVISPYIWALINRFGVQFLNLLNTIVLSRFLYPEDFGKIGVLAVFIHLSSVLADSGMGGSLIKERDLTSKDYDTVFTFNAIFSLCLYILLYASSPYLESFFGMTELSSICRIVSLPIILNAITIVPRAMAQKQLLFDKICTINLSAVLFAFISSVILAWLGFGVWALACNGIVSAIIENIGYRVLIKYRPNLRFSKHSFNKLFSFGLYTTLGTIIDTIYENFVAVCFGKYGNATVVGYFAQAKKIEEAPTKTISSAVGNVAFPVLCKLKDPIAFKNQAQKIQNVLLSLTAPVMCLMSIFAEEVIVVLLGNSWRAAFPYLSMLCVAGFFNVLETTNRTFIKSTGNSYVMLKASILKRCIGISLIMLCAYIDTNYIVLMFVITSIIGAFVNAIYLSKLTIISVVDQVIMWIKIVLPSMMMYVVGIYAKMIFYTGLGSAFVIFLVCAFLYFILLHVLRVNRIMLTVYKSLLNK